jgi:hypothetical protein
MDCHLPFLGECSVHLPCCSLLCTSYCFLCHTYYVLFSLSRLLLLPFSRLLFLLIALTTIALFMFVVCSHRICYFSFSCLLILFIMLATIPFLCMLFFFFTFVIVPLFALATTFLLRVYSFRYYVNTSLLMWRSRHKCLVISSSYHTNILFILNPLLYNAHYIFVLACDILQLPIFYGFNVVIPLTI